MARNRQKASRAGESRSPGEERDGAQAERRPDRRRSAPRGRRTRGRRPPATRGAPTPSAGPSGAHDDEGRSDRSSSRARCSATGPPSRSPRDRGRSAPGDRGLGGRGRGRAAPPARRGGYEVRAARPEDARSTRSAAGPQSDRSRAERKGQWPKPAMVRSRRRARLRSHRGRLPGMLDASFRLIQALLKMFRWYAVTLIRTENKVKQNLGTAASRWGRRTASARS